MAAAWSRDFDRSFGRGHSWFRRSLGGRVWWPRALRTRAPSRSVGGCLDEGENLGWTGHHERLESASRFGPDRLWAAWGRVWGSGERIQRRERVAALPRRRYSDTRSNPRRDRKEASRPRPECAWASSSSPSLAGPWIHRARGRSAKPLGTFDPGWYPRDSRAADTGVVRPGCGEGRARLPLAKNWTSARERHGSALGSAAARCDRTVVRGKERFRLWLASTASRHRATRGVAMSPTDAGLALC